MTQDTPPIFRGTAGRRTFIREADEGRLVIYYVTPHFAEKHCLRSEWIAWCKDHAPLQAVPGTVCQSPSRTVVVTEDDAPEGYVVVSVTEKRTMPRRKAERLLRRVALEAKREAKRAAKQRLPLGEAVTP